MQFQQVPMERIGACHGYPDELQGSTIIVWAVRNTGDKEVAMTEPRIPPEGPATAPVERKSPASLAGDVVRQGSNLIEQEVRLAKAELSEKMTSLKIAIGEIISGAVLLVASLGVLLAALVSGLARLLVALFAEEPLIGTAAAVDATRTLPTYESLAALLIGVIFALIGGLLLRNGLNRFDPGNLVPERTLRQARDTGDMVRGDT